ncbi:hypothetical protein [Pseudanabaena sp. FACHB-2040]|uniref:hypothetical protein n=1 Tax=Pseudanabaena sp. FACHB-2040 TaxID=2692859 RepID=UPI0016847C98|nr:hypothetical protein [Pseudanabaena sp. FACHB-2040]MBD2261124.1 hypothetical protein [Pseudanabaena sp. FACHB-2040]
MRYAQRNRYTRHPRQEEQPKSRTRWGNSPRSGLMTARQLLYWLAVLVAVIVACWNATPYVKVSFFVLTEVFSLNGIAGFFANRLLGMVSIFTGVILWGLIQTAETYPILLKHDRRLMRLIAAEADAADYLEIRDEDDPALVQLKLWYNHFPLLSIRAANRASLFAYIVDTAICLSVFPPVEGGFGRLVFVIFTGQWNLISWANVALILVMLFVFELMVRFVLFLGMQAYYLRRAHATA